MDNTLGIIIALVAAIATIAMLIFYVIDRSKKKLKVQMSSYVILEQGKEAPNGLEIAFMKIPVRCLTKTTFHIWNCSNTTISRDCIVDKSEFGYKFNSSFCLPDFNTLNLGRKDCHMGLIINGDTIRFNFDYLNKNDGFFFSVLHDSVSKPEQIGFYKEVRIQEMNSEAFSSWSRGHKTIHIAYSFIMLAFVISFLYAFIASLSNIGLSIMYGMLSLFLSILFYIVFLKPFFHLPPKHLVKKEKTSILQ